jgi:DNA-binding beta-propeller fold protein YncE
MRRSIGLLVVASIVCSAVGASAQKSLPLKRLQTVPLPDVKEGDFDHFTIDLAGKRLFLTAEDNNTVEVFDTGTNKLIRTLHEVKAPHAMVYFPDSKQLWVVSGGDGALKIFDTNTYALADTIKLTPAADSAGYDAAKHLLYVASGGDDAKMEYSLIDIVDTNARKRVGEIKVDSTNIEAMTIEKNGPKLFANVRDKNVVGVIDREKKTVLTTWTLGDVKSNTPMAFDEATHRLFVVGRKPPTLVVLDAETGKIVATLPTGPLADDAIFDPQGKRIYVACNGFTAVYIERDPDHYEELAKVPTGYRARTAILVPELKRYYTAASRNKEKPAELEVYEVQ